MQRATEARNEIGPLLDHLIRQLEAEGRATHRAHFARIQRSLQHAQDDLELASPIMALSTSASMGIQFSHDARVIITRILEKADHLAETLAHVPDRRH